ncbi:survival of motor neuron-related-splicing factor 30 [Thalassophryne amazonica]|uniref:survival of motor neuron-related-splicing factor 30 n=1 Tax=Thalassophryne amazonica TaxID=390379 RepID=UPI001471DCE0|nr:survival of motor neuron-related-splicing factor 30 [Thalassophryne amazonica]XP_034040775.1 survival of motor neuron-related-splicing factor 30 [Thalassophryne amazonica]
MSEELVKQLSSYKAQLQQVDVALSTDPDNEDLRKLQKDLQEVIDLTKDLLTSQPADAASTANGSDTVHPKHSWKVGNRCMALWSQDGQLYEAEIEEIDRENGTAAITFTGWGNAEVIPLQNLKPVEEGKRDDSGKIKPKSKKEQIAEQREYKKRKAQKKVQRIKELEQEREEQKSKWQQFNNKAYSKNKKGQVKRSIFASPESVNGKVGVGTCGIADKPMTQYNDTAKYNVRHLMPQ